LSLAEQRAEIPASTAGILEARSLETDFSRLHAFLLESQKPFLRVLDMGCGTGAITRGIANLLGSRGFVVGADVSDTMLEKARTTHVNVSNLEFVKADIHDLGFEVEFDLIVCARVLQWLEHPVKAVRQMVKALKLGGTLMVLDYNHLRSEFQPEPPASLTRVLEVYYAWKANAGMDNKIADHLEQMFLEAGLGDVVVTPQHEIATRGEPDFARRIGLKTSIIASRGHQLVLEGWLLESERATAEAEGRIWEQDNAEFQKLYLLAVEGIKVR
jgi:ubiquinone/menaquinone biosynthesis C-methylase UbiE